MRASEKEEKISNTRNAVECWWMALGNWQSHLVDACVRYSKFKFFFGPQQSHTSFEKKRKKGEQFFYYFSILELEAKLIRRIFFSAGMLVFHIFSACYCRRPTVVSFRKACVRTTASDLMAGNCFAYLNIRARFFSLIAPLLCFWLKCTRSATKKLEMPENRTPRGSFFRSLFQYFSLLLVLESFVIKFFLLCDLFAVRWLNERFFCCCWLEETELERERNALFDLLRYWRFCILKSVALEL